MKEVSRRKFIATSGVAAVGMFLTHPVLSEIIKEKGKLRVTLVGTGVRGITFWGKKLQDNYSDILEFVGLCDTNPGRLSFAKQYIGVDCKTYLDFDDMIEESKPDLVMVTTVDAFHHEYIIKGLKSGINVFSEKPMTTDEEKCQAILDAERESGKNLIIGFNYRYNPHYTKLKDLLNNQRVGKITSVDFHWYLNVYHGASYFRRWHGYREFGGTLWVHKATHHFDLLNWWLDSDPVEVTAYAELEHYGKNGEFRGDNCRSCNYKSDCKFYWDITKDQFSMDLYVDNEKYDGYIRDNCVFSEDINIYDKMSAQIKYANGVLVNYSLTTYSPYEGMRIAFNGMNGRIDAWDGIPWSKDTKLSQADLHEQEMSQSDEEKDFEEIYVMDNFGAYEQIKVLKESGGHGGGDKRLQDKIFANPQAPDPLKHSAGSRDGAMSVLIGIAARKSVETGKPVKIADLTDLESRPNRV
ncbi:Gfo/Idh/MocA family protein [Algoriphagus pacificus]|uniref:Gfo/Idh/MocA family oxidoreductase n=1 Tax=Algoriphagus pacificus TaxID=2811234 RepID=A0ABS3CGK0_9BACT|nr:Gfo/Idh/MocA family oxidoreductase [Algoriphagus pacificus]MBN7816232.1 Gfo/Idh/MocA family oxidoreductase [Algoriphagus pacificus]